MIDRAKILTLIPHKGTMCLLDGVRDWTEAGIACTALSHLDPANPLRRDGRLAAVCGCEYAFQAAALHGALVAGGTTQPQGWIAGLQVDRIGVARLDDPALGALRVVATLELAEAGGIIYRFEVAAEDGSALLQGRATIVLPRA